jgi:hypothetical protein
MPRANTIPFVVDVIIDDNIYHLYNIEINGSPVTVASPSLKQKTSNASKTTSFSLPSV